MSDQTFSGGDQGSPVVPQRGPIAVAVQAREDMRAVRRGKPVVFSWSRYPRSAAAGGEAR